jgi:glutamyl-tRNA reductase
LVVDGVYRGAVARILVGADFHDAPLSFLEAGELRSDALRRRLAEQSDVLAGSVVISTCHRLEVYAEVTDLYPALDAIVASLADILEHTVAMTGRIFRVLYESSVTRHLFSVTAGLEAMVVGETEIVGQVKKSLDLARQQGTLTPGLIRLFERAISSSKRVHTETGINDSGRSLIDAAIDVAGASLPPREQVRALIIGTGAYARVVRAGLSRRGVTEMLVYSPSGRAEGFAASHNLTAVPQDGLVEALGNVDLVVAASGQPGYVVTVGMVDAVRKRQESFPVTFIDLALARDIDPGISVIDGCTVVALDDLRDSADRVNRRSVWRAERLVDDLARQFADSERARSIDPLVTALRDNIAQRVADEIARVRSRHGDDVAQQVEKSLRRVTNSLLHEPVTRGRDLAINGQHDDYARAIRTLFNVEAPLNG